MPEQPDSLKPTVKEKAMKDPCLADFYHGWIIEVLAETEGFKSVCYSPSRQRLTDHKSYPSDICALVAAKRLINQHLACHSMSVFLRDAYEAGNLSFEEWRSLNHSLTAVLTMH
jgi:hypothetical protein